MLTKEGLEEIVSQISFKDWQFKVDTLGDGFFIQVQFQDLDHDTGELSLIKGRKWYISKFAIPDEVVKTCWVAVDMVLRHEALECFLVNGIAPFHPHNDSFAMLFLPKVHREDIVPEPILS